MKKFYGKNRNGLEVNSYTFTNKNGMEVTFLDFGAIINSAKVPDGKGGLVDVILASPDADSYIDDTNGFGAPIGPNANRVADAVCEIDGVTYNLLKNDGENNLHTDIPNGLHKRHWDCTEEGNSLICRVSLKDGELRLPGNREFTIKYTLTDDNEIRIDYLVKSDKNTMINMTNHSYFNLNGHDSGLITGHTVTLASSTYTKIREGAIPTGEIVSVIGTELDFTTGKTVGRDINSDNEQMKFVNGYDFNHCVDGYDGSVKKIAHVEADKTDITMDVFTDLPGVHFYTGNWVCDAPGKDGALYQARYGMCFETQYYPDSIHHDNFPDVVFGPSRDYKSTTIFKFGVK